MEAYGEKLVWDLGLEALRFPPTWAHTVSEANKVMLAIKAYYDARPNELLKLQGEQLTSR